MKFSAFLSIWRIVDSATGKTDWTDTFIYKDGPTPTYPSSGTDKKDTKS